MDNFVERLYLLLVEGVAVGVLEKQAKYKHVSFSMLVINLQFSEPIYTGKNLFKNF